MDKITIHLSSKALHFVVEAVESQIRDYETRLNDTAINEDDYADVGNDMQFLKAILEDLRKQAQ